MKVQEYHDLDDPRRVVRGFAGRGGVARPFRPLLPPEVAPEPWVAQQQAAMPRVASHADPSLDQLLI